MFLWKTLWLFGLFLGTKVTLMCGLSKVRSKQIKYTPLTKIWKPYGISHVLQSEWKSPIDKVFKSHHYCERTQQKGL